MKETKKTKTNKNKKSRSSNYWLKEHFSDIYVKRARQEGFRARSVYKLMEIQNKYKIIKSDMLVIDLGAAPGGWSEYISQLVKLKSNIFALDILPMHPIEGVNFICGDFTNCNILQTLINSLNNRKADVILSDMAPNLSGVDIIDQARSIDLAKKSFEFAKNVLKKGGTFLFKVFQGSEVADFLKLLSYNFDDIKVVKPDASRARSSEVFVLARNFR